MTPSQRKIIIVLGTAVVLVFTLIICLLTQGLSPSLTPASLPTPTPSPSPTIDVHLYDEMCAGMRQLRYVRLAYRKKIESNADFIRRIEVAFEQGDLPEEDRLKAHWLVIELEDYQDFLIYQYKFGILWDGPKYPNLPREVKEWAGEDCDLHGRLATELDYFTQIGEERRRWEKVWRVLGTKAESIVTVNEYMTLVALQDRAFEQLMEQYCQ